MAPNDAHLGTKWPIVEPQDTVWHQIDWHRVKQILRDTYICTKWHRKTSSDKNVKPTLFDTKRHMRAPTDTPKKRTKTWNISYVTPSTACVTNNWHRKFSSDKNLQDLMWQQVTLNWTIIDTVKLHVTRNWNRFSMWHQATLLWARTDTEKKSCDKNVR